MQEAAPPPPPSLEDVGRMTLEASPLRRSLEISPLKFHGRQTVQGLESSLLLEINMNNCSSSPVSHQNGDCVYNAAEKMNGGIHNDSSANRVVHFKKVRFIVGQDVLARWNDGLFYLGNIMKIDEKSERCYIRFEDDSEYWVMFKDIQRGAKEGEIMCCSCQGEMSDAPNEIVLCDNCGLGYHQQCHNPSIESEVLKPDVEWLCRLCVFATTVKRGGALKKGPNARALQAMKQSLPYDLNSLTWDAQHKTNVDQCYCYCGGPGDWYMKMLQCCRCRQWFHEACIQCLEKPLLYGDRFYLFVCSFCNSGPEYIKRIQLKWVDITQLTLFNLSIGHKKKYYDLQQVIMPWINQNWDKIQMDSLDSTLRGERSSMVLESLKNHKKRFQCGREIKKRTTLWGLRLRLPPHPPHIGLPAEGQITNEVINSLMKGKRMKTFASAEGQSPIPLKYKRKSSIDSDDSVTVKNKRSRKLLIDGSGKKAVHSDKQENSGKRRDCRCTLDTIIPHLGNYEGYNHPFKTVLEQNEELAKHRLKTRILDLYQNGIDPDTVNQNATNEKPSNLKQPIITHMKRKYTKRKPCMLSSKATPAAADTQYNVVNSAAIDAMSTKQINLKELKSSVSNYFGAADRLAHGEKFHVLARRVTPQGKVQYLVQWEGIIT